MYNVILDKRSTTTRIESYTTPLSLVDGSLTMKSRASSWEDNCPAGSCRGAFVRWHTGQFLTCLSTSCLSVTERLIKSNVRSAPKCPASFESWCEEMTSVRTAGSSGTLSLVVQ